MTQQQCEFQLLKLARQAFDLASTLHPTQHIDVYLLDGQPKISDVLDEGEEIVYGGNRILCYQIGGYDYLEEEIKLWIDQARTPFIDEHGIVHEPTELEKAITEVTAKLAQPRSLEPSEVSSYEVFANLSVDLIEQIEHAILEYWWQGIEEENGRALALEQIREGMTQAGMI